MTVSSTNKSRLPSITLRAGVGDVPKFSDISSIVDAYAGQDLAPFHMFVHRNSTIEAIVPYLQYFGLRLDLKVSVEVGQYGMLLQESQAPNTSGADQDGALVCLSLEGQSPKLSNDFVTLSKQEIEDEIAQIELFVRTVVNNLHHNGVAFLLWFGFDTPRCPAMGVTDGSVKEGQTKVIQRLNACIEQAVCEIPGFYFVDIDQCRRKLGDDRFYDVRYKYLADAGISREGLCEIARVSLRYVAAYKGLIKKCVVVDCDNTLWGGIIGEDGVEGIKIGEIYPGSAYRDFQRSLVNLAHRGVLVAICSKNNEEDVWRAFDNIDTMILTKDNISAYQINWDDKAANIQALSETLDIGLDSIVFVDDSEFEIGLINDRFPQVATILMPVSEPYKFGDLLYESGYFDTLSITDEDRKRTDMYRESSGRKELSKHSLSISDYIKSLEIELKVAYVNSETMERASQLTQRTNQFNLTTRRYSISQLEEYVLAPDNHVLTLSVKDRFGVMGIVGLAMMSVKEHTAVVDNFLMSCRVLGRDIEFAFLDEVVSLAERLGAKKVKSKYFPTQKNVLVENFYDNNEFVLLKEQDGTKDYECAVSRESQRKTKGLHKVSSMVELSVKE